MKLDLKRVAELRSATPRTTIAQIRLAWPEIEAALERGHSLKDVHSSLKESGIEIEYRTLSEYIGRIRRAHLRLEPQRRALTHALVISKGTAAPENCERRATDAMADFQQRTNRRTIFEFKPCPPDESKLI
jgi:hypothetical protein